MPYWVFGLGAYCSFVLSWDRATGAEKQGIAELDKFL